MKSVSKEISEEIHLYPKFMKSINCGYIVLFSEQGVGMVVHQEEKASGDKVGDYSNDWIMSNFKVYTGTLTQSN